MAQLESAEFLVMKPGRRSYAQSLSSKCKKLGRVNQHTFYHQWLSKKVRKVVPLDKYYRDSGLDYSAHENLGNN